MSKDHPQSSLHRDIYSDVEHEDGWGDVALASTPNSRARDEASQDAYITHDLRTYRAEKVGPLRKQGLQEGSSSSSGSRRSEKQKSLPMGGGRFPNSEEVTSLTTRRTPFTPTLMLRNTPSHQSNLPDHDACKEEIAVQSNYPSSTTVRGTETEATAIISDKRGGREGSPRRSSFSGLETTGKSSFQRNSVTDREILALPSAQALMSDATLEKALGDIRSREDRVGRRSRDFTMSEFETRENVGSGRDRFAGSNIEWAQRSPSQSEFGETGALHELPERTSHTEYFGERVGSAQFPLSLSDMHFRNDGYFDEGSGRHPSAQFPSLEFDMREQEDNPRNSNLSNENVLCSSTESILSEVIIVGSAGGRSSNYRAIGGERQPSTPFAILKSGTLREADDGSRGIKNSGGGDGGSYEDVSIEWRPSIKLPFMEMDAAGGGSAKRSQKGARRSPSVRQSFSNIDILEKAFGRNVEAISGTDSRQSSPQPTFLEVDMLGQAQNVGENSGYVGSDGKRQSLRQSHFSNISATEADDGIRSSFAASAMMPSAGNRVGSRNSYTGSGVEEQPTLLSPFEMGTLVSVDGRVLEGGDGRRSSYHMDSGLERRSSGTISGGEVLGVDVNGQAGLNRSDDEKRLSSFFRDDRPGEAEGAIGVESRIDDSRGSLRYSIPHLGAQHGEEVNDWSSVISKRGNERLSQANFPLSSTDIVGGDDFARDSFVDNKIERRSSSSRCSLDADRHGEGSVEKDDDSLIDGERWASPSGSEPLLNEIVKSRRGRESGRTYVNSGGSRQASRLFQVASEIVMHGDEGGENSCAGSYKEWRSSMKEPVAGGVLEPLRELRQASVIPCRRDSRLASLSEIDRVSEPLSERVRGRGSLNHSSRRASRVVISPSSEVAGSDDFNTQDRDEVSTNGAVPEEDEPSLQRRNSFAAQVGERVPPEWALLLLGCLLGLATGVSVVIFNKGVHFIHDMAWAGTPREGAAWLRLQQLIDIWHRVMLIPVVGGVVVGMMHAVVGILDQVKGCRPPLRTNVIDWLAGAKPAVKAGQAMVTLGTGCSLGPEGPSVDIGKAWAHGLATVMKNNRERRIALVAAGAAAGISAGFNAPVSGMFFAIETVLRPQHAENSPPLTTAMIILASVISSATSQVLLEETAAFTVPNYELRSAAELPLYLILGGVCGVVSVAFTWMTTYLMEGFELLRDRCGIPHTVTPAIGGLVTGLVSLKYPGVLYWGFYNVDEILHSGKTATAPGAWLVTQLICAKVFATAFCKGSGLVGGVYAPSLFVGAAVGSVYGTMAGKIVNAAIPGQDTVAHPQAYALVGMAALLAAVCSVPLTSVLLLFELTKDYHILLPLMGGIGVAIWVASVAKPSSEKHFASSATAVGRSFRPLSTTEEGASDVRGRERQVWRRTGSRTEVELCTLDDYEGPEVVSDDELMESVKVSQAMSKTFVKVQPIATVKETIGSMLLKQRRCALVVDENDLIEGIFTFADLESEVVRAAEGFAKGDRALVEVDKMLVAAFCSGNGDKQGTGTDLLVCFPDMSLKAALEIMQSSGYKQLPVVARAGKRWQDEGRQVVGLLYGDAIPRIIREEASKRISAMLAKSDEDDDAPLLDAH